MVKPFIVLLLTVIFPLVSETVIALYLTAVAILKPQNMIATKAANPAIIRTRWALFFLKIVLLIFILPVCFDLLWFYNSTNGQKKQELYKLSVQDLIFATGASW